MINPIEAYTECGQMAGKAQNEKDAARVAFHTTHYHRMRNLEKNEDRDVARKAFDSAYYTARAVPKVRSSIVQMYRHQNGMD